MSMALPEKYQIINCIQAGTTMNTASTSVWMDARKFHSLTIVASVKRPAADGFRCQFYASSDSAGGGSVIMTTGVKWWVQDNTTETYRMTKATSSPSSHTVGASTGFYMICAQFDPARLSSSRPWVSFGISNEGEALNFCNAFAFAETLHNPGYKVNATSSST